MVWSQNQTESPYQYLYTEKEFNLKKKKWKKKTLNRFRTNLRSFKYKEGMRLDQKKDGFSNSMIDEQRSKQQWFNCGSCTHLLMSHRAIGSYLCSLYGPPKCWPEANGLPDISLAQMGLFRIHRKLQFRVCNHGKPGTVPSCKIKRMPLYE